MRLALLCVAALPLCVGVCADNEIYGASWALLVGINDYRSSSIPDLRFCESDVDALATILAEKHALPREHMAILKGSEATRARILEELSRLTDHRRGNERDRVVVYFSGHGQTVPLPRGGQMGFLIPVDAAVDIADVTNPALYYKTCVAMSELHHISELIPAKHVLFLVDACYSGLAVDALRSARPPASIAALARNPGRHILTAGMRGERAMENPRWGHGAFTQALLEALSDRRSDYNNDGFLTAQELATYVQGEVPKHSPQTPQFACFGGEGQCLFCLDMTETRAPRPPRIEITQPAELRTRDVRILAKAAGETVRLAGLVHAESPVASVTVDGRAVGYRKRGFYMPIRGLDAETAGGDAPAPGARAAASHTVGFSTDVPVEMGQEKTVEVRARDSAGLEGVLRLHIASAARDTRPPQVRIAEVSSVALGSTPDATRRGTRAVSIEPTRVIAAVMPGEALRIAGLARDDRAVISVRLDRNPLRLSRATEEQLLEMGWERGVYFETDIAQPAGTHELIARDAADNESRIVIVVGEQGEQSPQIAIIEPVQRRGTGLKLPKGEHDLRVVGLARGSADIVRVTVGDRRARLRPATAADLGIFDWSPPAVRFEARAPVPPTGAVAQVAVTATDAEGRTATRVVLARSQPGPISLKFASDQPRYRIGEKVHFALECNQEAYAYIFHREPDGSLIVFLPNSVEPDNMLRAAVARTFPDPRAERHWRGQYCLIAQEPAGTDTAYCLAIPCPLPASLVQELSVLPDLAEALAAAGRIRGTKLVLPAEVNEQAIANAAEQLGGTWQEVRYRVRR